MARMRRYSQSDIIRAAYLAGGGATADDIAEAIGGGAKAQNVYSLLSRHGIRLVPKTRAQSCFPVVISRDAMSAAARHAAARGVDPQWLIGRVIEQCLRDRAIAGELVKRVRTP
jgi:hypothetical protein